MYKELERKIQEILKISNQKNICSNTGLLTGEAGISMLEYTSYNYLNNSACLKRGLALLENIFTKIKTSDKPLINTFCSGLAGIGWFVDYIIRQGFIDGDSNDILSELDDLLGLQLKYYLKEGNWDFLHGATGIGIYFVQRFRQKCEVLDNLGLLLNYLEQSAEKETSTQNSKWKSILNIETGEVGYNISLSHGISSIVILLSKMVKANIFQERSKKLLEGAVNYILAQEIDKNKFNSFFPYYSIESEGDIRGSRLAWCYGDLGIASTLWQASVITQNENWKNKAIEVLLFAAEKRRDLEKEFVKDAGLCHGTAGIAHIFYRAWWNTKMPEFEKAANFWFQETLKMSCFKDGLAGYKAWHGKRGWTNEYEILEGIFGIGLAMISYVTKTEPTWDECLLLS